MPELKMFLPKGAGEGEAFRITLEPWSGDGGKYVLKASYKLSDNDNSLDLHVELVEGE